MEAPEGGNQDRGPQMIAMIWIEAAIAVVVVALRIWGRVIIHQVGPDDYVMLFTLFIFLILSGFITYYAHIGGLKHLFYLEPAQQAMAVKYNWITQPWAIFGFATGKVSVALLILRIIGPNTFWRKWILYFAMGSALLFTSLGCIFTFVQCDPPRALWTPQLIAAGQAKCWDSRVQADYAIFLSSWNVLIDVLLAVLPVTIFYNLSLSIPKKLGLCALLGLGLVAGVCGIIKTKFLASLNARSDLTWDTFDLFAWSAAELFVIIVCGSIPPIRPLYEYIFGGKRHARTGYSQHSYAMDSSLKGDGHTRPMGSMNRDSTRSPDEERVAMVEMPRNASGGITKVTDVRVTREPQGGF